MRFIDEYLKDIKRQKNVGRCLHYESGDRCNNIANAHTIQQGNLLSLIQEEGHVINISADYSDLKRSGGKLVAKRIGVNKVSTFLGFCQKHDNELFELIDNYPFFPSKEQAFLYSYRALCREYFTKENAIKVFENQASRTGLSNFQRHCLEASLLGSMAGFERIKYHKERFDKSLSSSCWKDIRYVSFNISERPTVLVSGAIFPDFDFLGYELQDLGDLEAILSMAAFFIAPTNSGWSFVFAWHSSSDEVCERLKRSLATCVYNKESLSDILFRCIFSWSENHAISPSWWGSLTKAEKEAVCERSLYMIHPEMPIRNDYLRVGLEGICKWKVESVQDGN
jgi:hypothetical protein